MPATLPSSTNGAILIRLFPKGRTVIEILPGEIGAQHVRLAVSPLEEVLNAVRVLSRPGRSPVHARWAIANRSTLTWLDVPELVTLLDGDRYFPDFLSPPPHDRVTTVEDQLEALIQTPADQVRTEIMMSAAGRDSTEDLDELLKDPIEARDLLAQQLRSCWDVLIKPIWPRLQDVLRTDIDHRTRQFGEGGLAKLLGSVRPGVTVNHGRILLPTFNSGRLDLDERGLLLVPSVFASNIGVMMVPPWQPSLVYPARGAATLWEDVPAPKGDPLAGVVGRTKARLLRALDEPASTTTLAERLGAAPSTISEHVKALAAAGLLSGRRAGRSVNYSRSSLGDELVSSAT
jgi:DNA-binding transcriptional ArsR family regulator